MSKEPDDEGPFWLAIPPEAFEAILCNLYEIVELLQGLLRDSEEEHPILRLVKKGPPERGH